MGSNGGSRIGVWVVECGVGLVNSEVGVVECGVWGGE